MKPSKSNNNFNLISKYKPEGDQPIAIEKLTLGIKEGAKNQTLMGVTGSGKTFVMSNVIANIGKPTLVIAHNKTLAAQLASEFKNYFPNNAVAYFVSYYDYYQPEAYIPTKDMYIEKETRVNEEIEKYRNKATQFLQSRNDVIIVSSVSCIYGLGSPDEYNELKILISRKDKIKRHELFTLLNNIQYSRNDIEYQRGTFRVKGDIIEIFPPYEENIIRIEMFDDEIESITLINPLTRSIIENYSEIYIYPAKHYLVKDEKIKKAIVNIRQEMKDRINYFKKNNQLVEAQRLEQRVKFDLEMIEEMGYCQGIENYSRHLEGRAQGSAPYTLLDFFPKDYLLIIDESHMTIPQIRGMYKGDYARKKTLVDYGFRLPSAIDNRPLRFDEFQKKINQVIYVSATPNDFEVNISSIGTKNIKGYPKSGIVEQIIRPTKLVDPTIEVRPTKNQIDDIKKEIDKRIKNKERTIVITLTKKMAEELSTYFKDNNLKTQYLHSEIHTIERTEILQDLRLGTYDVLVGINLLREGLDLPEVSLMIILDADKEGFLRSKQSLIQTMGRVSRHVSGNVIMYADIMTDSMKEAIKETTRRRNIQLAYNKKYGFKPLGITKSIDTQLERSNNSRDKDLNLNEISDTTYLDTKDIVAKLKKQMKKYSDNMEFEKAASIRDKIREIKLT
ncbi:MAG: excinuclease ABC subunit UvrB [Patescibacteria group bacterium]